MQGHTMVESGGSGPVTKQINLAPKKFRALQNCVLLDDKLARGNFAPRLGFTSRPSV